MLFTANDAYMRGMRIYAPADCIVSNAAEENTNALEQIEIVLKGDTTPSTELRFKAGVRGKRQRTSGHIRG